MNLLEEVQRYVADKLNADSQLSACPFLVENRRDIDFEIKQALGKQGIVGLVMTPKATYAGAYMDVGIAWQIDALEIDVVENVTVNRGKKNGYITGQDAAMRLFDVLCPLSGEGEGTFCPVSYEEGEDNSLLVNKSVLKCLVHKLPPSTTTTVVYRNGDVVEYDINGQLARGQISGLTSIVSLEIGRGVTGLATNAFYSSTNLSSVTIPNSVSSIGNSAFKNCYQLTGISLPDSVQSIAEDAFAEDPNIEVTFQGRTKAEVQAMENYPWGIENTQNIHSIIGPNTRVKYGWSQSWDSLPLSGTLNSNDLPSRDGIRYIGIGSSIDEIGYRAFSGMEFLTGVEIPTTVTAIGAQAFSGAEGMTDIEIPSSVSSIGSDAFFGCHILSSVMFEGKTLEQVQAMANYPWSLSNGSVVHCIDGDIIVGADTKVTYQNGDVVEYGITGELTRGQISSLTSVVSLEIGSGVTGLATNAFYSCINLSSVTIPNSVSSIGTYAFRNCYRLTSISLPDSVTNLSGSTFYDCTGLKSASLGNSLSAVPGAIFSGCSNLSSVTLPISATVIGEGAFGGCASLRSIDIPDSVSSLNNSAFRNCYNLVDVHMPSSLKIIREYAFENCRSLSSVTIPESVGFIGADAFHGCTTVANVYCYPYWGNLNWDEADKDDFKQDGSTICHVRPGYLGGYVSKFGNTVNVTFAGDLA